MQINRLFEIVYLLLEKQIMTAGELAEHFEVSTRTIYRDIETLSGAGIPVYMSKGKGGGISLLPDFILNKTVLSEEERENMLSSLRALRQVVGAGTDSTLQKLNSLFGTAGTDWIEVSFSSWMGQDEEDKLFNDLKEAILSKRVIRFEYSGIKENKRGNVKENRNKKEEIDNEKRIVEPLKLCFKGDAWYLYGFCRSRQDNRFFKLRRIKKCEFLEENFNRTTPACVLEKEINYQKEFWNVKLKLSKEIAYRVYDEFDSYEQLEEGNFIVQCPLPKEVWTIYYIHTFGSDCEVLEPLELREKVKEELRKTLEKY